MHEPIELQHNRIGEFKVLVIEEGKRISPPSTESIAAMAESLSTSPQLQPIMIRKSSAEGYTVVLGATRLAAARKLKMDVIWAVEVAAANVHDYKIIECEENLRREHLSASERKRLEQIQLEERKQRAADIMAAQKYPAAKPERKKRKDIPTGKPPGRPKGGVRDAGRQAGVNHATARAVARSLDRAKKER